MSICVQKKDAKNQRAKSKLMSLGECNDDGSRESYRKATQVETGYKVLVIHESDPNGKVHSFFADDFRLKGIGPKVLDFGTSVMENEGFDER